MKIKNLYTISIILLIACSSSPTAQEIIDKSIVNYGGKAIYNSDITFTFRDKQYRALYQKVNYQLERTFNDSLGVYHDVLTNTSFTRKINDSNVILNDEWINKYSNSINSVTYFFRIPFHLNEKAVTKKMIGTSTINGNDYYKIKVGFMQVGGGEDFSDKFVYWVNKSNYTIDYFAYSYETSGGGKRFRAAINPRKINNLLVMDYINYEPRDTSIAIEHFDEYYQKNGMKELSRIENKNVVVKYLE